MHHQHLLSILQKHGGTPVQHEATARYVGNDHPYYAISIPVLRKIAKEWLRENPLSTREFTTLLTNLTQASSATEKTIAGLLLDYATPAQKTFKLSLFDRWLTPMEGWAEVDALCYGHFSWKHFDENRDEWHTLIKKLNKSSNRNKRRASLVLLCKPLSQAEDRGLAELAFQCITRLTHEKEILITKAISWLLRSMVKHHRKAVQQFLKGNEHTLPKIALRETQVKLRTGKKNASR